MSRRRIRSSLALALLGLTVALLAGSAPATADPPATGPLYVVVFKDRVNPIIKILLLGVRPKFIYRYALSGFAAQLTPRQQAKLAADRDVLMVTPGDRDSAPLRVSASGATPIEQFPQVAPRGIRRIGTLASPTAHIDGHEDPMNVDVAVLDTAIDASQPDLNVRGSVSCNDNPGVPGSDADYHGTMVAGVIGARDNAFGVVGVAPGARLWSVRVLDPSAGGTDANLLCGIDWVTQHARTIEVANLSLIDTGADDGQCGLANHDPVHWAICHSVNAGVTYVTGAGNNSADASAAIPASFSEVITVSGMADEDGLPGGLGGETCEGDPDDSFSWFSNFGAPVDIAAPAECVGSTFPGGQIALDSGTSSPAPAVAGAAALIKLRHPWATPAQVKEMILAAREQVHLPGDPDGIDEGVLNVSTF